MRAAILILLALLAMPGHANDPQSLHIGIDASLSAPLYAREASNRALYAQLAADKAAALIRNMRLGDVVRVQYLGARQLGNLKTLEITISHRARAPQVADAIAALIKREAEQERTGQPWTALTRFLALGTFDCAAGDHILLISDGIESTPETDHNALLAGRAGLPAPAPGSLSGCSLTIFGIGVSAGGVLSTGQTDRLSKAWQDYAQQAGASLWARPLQ